MPILTGLARIGRNAEVRDANGTSVCNLSLAFNARVKNERVTVWVDGELWGKQAERLAPYLTKGSVVSVTLNEVHMAVFTKDDGSTVDLSGDNRMAYLLGERERLGAVVDELRQLAFRHEGVLHVQT